MGGLRLQHRIVIPFVIVALVATGAAAWVALSVAAGALQSRVQTQLVSAAAVMGRGDLALNPAILRTLQDILGASIVTVDAAGEVVASSLDADGAEIITAVRQVIASGGGAPAEPRPLVESADCGVPCLIAYGPIEGRPDVTVALVADTSELERVTRTVARAILLAAAFSVAVMVLVSQAVVRRVTSPLDALIRFARELSPQDSRRRATVGDDEVGALADAFNGMLDRLAHSQDALVRSEKLALAGLFAARVAHDIRNPLSSIKMQTQLLRARAGARSDDAAILGSVIHDVDLVESVIRNLLELARPGEMKRVPASLARVVDDALEQLDAQFTYRKISVETRLEPGLPVVHLDPVRFKQALLNVLVNASDAMPTGGQITIAARAAGAGALDIEICDDGVGIDPAILATAFDPFVSTKPQGVGLGLVNVKAVVEGHGGSVSLRAHVPHGACVVIRLPVGDTTASHPSREDGEQHG